MSAPSPKVLPGFPYSRELGPRCRSCKPGLGVEVGYPVPAPKVLSVTSGSVLSTDPSSGSTSNLPGKPFWFPEDPQAQFLSCKPASQAHCRILSGIPSFAQPILSGIPSFAHKPQEPLCPSRESLHLLFSSHSCSLALPCCSENYDVQPSSWGCIRASGRPQVAASPDPRPCFSSYFRYSNSRRCLSHTCTPARCSTWKVATPATQPAPCKWQRVEGGRAQIWLGP